MDTNPIQVLRPNVTQEDALRKFSSAGFSGLYWRVRSGPLQRIAAAYVPYTLYRVDYQVSGRMHASLVATALRVSAARKASARHFPARLLQGARPQAGNRAAAHGIARSLLARILWRSIPALPRDGRGAPPHRRRQGFRVFRALAGGLMRPG